MKKIISIEILRGLAAVLVVILHVMVETHHRSSYSILINFYNLKNFGYIGVDIFFVISGFIMVLVHWNDFQKPNASLQFLRKRFLRIAPLYWFFTVLASLLLIFLPEFSSRGVKFDFMHFIMSLSFIPWNNSVGTMFPVLGVGWTLNYEMYFYILFAFCLLFSRKYFLLNIIALFIGGFIISNLGDYNFPLLKMIGNPLLFEFLGGVIIGLLYKNNIVIKNYTLFLIISMSLIICNIFSHVDHSYKFIFFGLPSLMLLYSVISLEFNTNFFLSINSKIIKPLLIVGSSSYSIYLSHPFVLKGIYKLIPKSLVVNYPDLIIFAVSSLAILVGILVYYAIEIPILKSTKKLFNKENKSTYLKFSK